VDDLAVDEGDVDVLLKPLDERARCRTSSRHSSATSSIRTMSASFGTHRHSPAVPSLIKFLGLRSRDGLDCPLPV
jgi:hypothetical protein